MNSFDQWWARNEVCVACSVEDAQEIWEAATLAGRERIAKKVDEWTGLELLAKEIRQGEI